MGLVDYKDKSGAGWNMKQVGCTYWEIYTGVLVSSDGPMSNPITRFDLEHIDFPVNNKCA